MADLRVINGKQKDNTNASVHNVVLNGVTYHFRAVPCCGDGVTLFYDKLVKLTDIMPEALARVVGNGADEVMQNVTRAHIHLKWYDRLLFRSLEAKARHHIKRLKGDILKHEHSKVTAENLGAR